MLNRHERERRARERLDAAVFSVCVAALGYLGLSMLADWIGWPW